MKRTKTNTFWDGKETRMNNNKKIWKNESFDEKENVSHKHQETKQEKNDGIKCDSKDEKDIIVSEFKRKRDFDLFERRESGRRKQNRNNQQERLETGNERKRREKKGKGFEECEK